jgi:site-specific recombinase XerD
MEDNLVADYLTNMRLKGMHRDTIADYAMNLRDFGQYLSDAGRSSFFAADEAIMRGFSAAVKKRNLSASTIWKKQHAVYAFYEWLQREGLMLLNPALNPVFTARRRLPRSIPDWTMLKDVYRKVCRSGRYVRFRDCAIIDLAYGCGLRRCELHRLNIDDITPDEPAGEKGGTIRVRGKGDRARVVPIGPRALKDLLSYVYHVRPRLMPTGFTKALFVSWNGGGKRMHLYSINAMFRRLRLKYGFGKSFAPHKLRHAFATDLIRNGAPVQDVAKMLGHVKLETTQVYTQLAPTDMKRCHERFHPRG